MNDRLIQQFIQQAGAMPAQRGDPGARLRFLVGMVAERCAVICDILQDDPGAPRPAQAAAETIRAAFCESISNPKLTPTALASKIATH